MTLFLNYKSIIFYFGSLFIPICRITIRAIIVSCTTCLGTSCRLFGNQIRFVGVSASNCTSCSAVITICVICISIIVSFCCSSATSAGSLMLTIFKIGPICICMNCFCSKVIISALTFFIVLVAINMPLIHIVSRTYNSLTAIILSMLFGGAAVNNFTGMITCVYRTVVALTSSTNSRCGTGCSSAHCVSFRFNISARTGTAVVGIINLCPITKSVVSFTKCSSAAAICTVNVCSTILNTFRTSVIACVYATIGLTAILTSSLGCTCCNTTRATCYIFFIANITVMISVSTRVSVRINHYGTGFSRCNVKLNSYGTIITTNCNACIVAATIIAKATTPIIY